MSAAPRNVVVVGGGIAGLSAAERLSHHPLRIELVERSGFLGGHAAQFACKADGACVRCGACLVEQTLGRVTAAPAIRPRLYSRVTAIDRADGLRVRVERQALSIDGQKCSNCGICREVCPEPDGVRRAFSGHHQPHFAINPAECRFLRDGSCSRCLHACPEGAIRLDSPSFSEELHADAIVLATGFKAYDPSDKPYGYNHFANVITNLDLERRLRRDHRLERPSDQRVPQRVAFIQCVGSRDAKLKHLWCSKVCCASALRLAGLLRHLHPEVAITVFYIDIQTFGKDFSERYAALRRELTWVRTIPSDIFRTPDDRLRVTAYDAPARQPLEETFDLVVLSVGITPTTNNPVLTGAGDPALDPAGFLPQSVDGGHPRPAGIFFAGTACGPMDIAASITHADQAAWDALGYLFPDGRPRSGA